MSSRHRHHSTLGKSDSKQPEIAAGTILAEEGKVRARNALILYKLPGLAQRTGKTLLRVRSIAQLTPLDTKTSKL